MKKISVAIAGLLFSGLASAVPLSASGLLPVTVCANLNEDVNISLTTGVVAGFSCTSARVAIAACHTAGMLKSRSVGRKNVTIPDPSPTAAPGATITVVQSCTVGTADPACVSTPVTGAAVATATSARGTVNTQYPGTGACATAAVPDAFAATIP